MSRMYWVTAEKASENKLKDTKFNFPMNNVMYFSLVRTHAQMEDIKHLDLKNTSILIFQHILLFEKGLCIHS